MDAPISIKIQQSPFRLLVFVDTATAPLTRLLADLYGSVRDLTVDICSEDVRNHWKIYAKLLEDVNTATEFPLVASVQGDVVGDQVVLALSNIADATFQVTSENLIFGLTLRRAYGPFAVDAVHAVRLKRDGCITPVESSQGGVTGECADAGLSKPSPQSTFSLFLTPEQAEAKSKIILPHMRIVGRESDESLPVLAYDYDPEDEIEE